MSLNNLADLFHDELRDVLSAERQLVQALPKMISAANSEKLKAAFKNHLEETKEHVDRVERSFEELGKAARAKTCEAMKGLLEESKSMLEEDADPEVKDAALICCAQKVEHYEIATYGTLCTWAEILGYTSVLKLLKQNMSDEENADQKLSSIAKKINVSANDSVKAS